MQTPLRSPRSRESSPYMLDDAPPADLLDSTPVQLQVRNRQIAAVHAISRLLSSTLDQNARMVHILRVSMEAVGATAGTLFLHKPKERKLVFEYVVGEKANELTGVEIEDHFGMVGAVFHSGQGQITNRPMESDIHRPEFGENVGFRTQSILTVPLKVQSGQPVGVIQLLNKQDGEFLTYDLEVLEIVAAISATAIENARLFDEAQAAIISHRVGDLSHDIKNKVSPIPMALQTLEPTIDSMLADLDELADSVPSDISSKLRRATLDFRQDYPEYFGMIMDQVHAVQGYTKLIADTLKGATSAPVMEVQDLNSVIERQISSLLLVGRQRGVELCMHLGDIPPFAFDRARVEWAVYNLVNNAIPETPAGGSVSVRTSGPAPFGPDGRLYVTTEVADTGRGMPPEKLSEILGGEAKSDKVGGTGLGTRIVYKSILDQNGIFEGASEPRKGTTFWMRLPLETR